MQEKTQKKYIISYELVKRKSKKRLASEKSKKSPLTKNTGFYNYTKITIKSALA